MQPFHNRGKIGVRADSVIGLDGVGVKGANMGKTSEHLLSCSQWGAGNAFFFKIGKSFEGWAEGMVAKICDNIFSIQKMKFRLALMASGELCWLVGR